MSPGSEECEMKIRQQHALNINRGLYCKFIALMVAFAILTLLSACLVLPGSGSDVDSTEDDPNDHKAYSVQYLGTFDTVITIIGHTKTEEEFDRLAEYAKGRFRELNDLYDIYNEYDGINNACTINENAGKSPVVIGDELMDLLEFAVEWYDKTNGKVNVAFGSVLKVWHDHRDAADPLSADNEIPSIAELEKAAEHVSIDILELDREKMTAYISDPMARIDLGAMAKGYATELICDELEKRGHDSFAISAGGNVKVVGKPLAKSRDEWIIGIQDPEGQVSSGANEDVIDKVLVRDLSVVTSGWYQRFFISGGKIYHHIIDPQTLFPQDHYKAVTVVHPDSGVCDVLSTALMLMPWDEGSAFLAGITDADAYWILSDGSVKTTAGMDSILLSGESGS